MLLRCSHERKLRRANSRVKGPLQVTWSHGAHMKEGQRPSRCGDDRGMRERIEREN